MAKAIEISTEGFDESIAALSQSAHYIRERIAKPLEVLNEVRSRVVAGAPTKTGALRASITQTRLSASASTGAVSAEIRAGRKLPRPYDYWVEYGTARMSARAFFWPPIEGSEPRIAQEFGLAVDDIVKHLAGGLAV
jgi:hypothetical protein